MSTTEVAFDSTEARDLAKVDMDFFGMLAMPDDVIYSFPEFYKQVWSILIGCLHKSRDFSKYAIGLPRGHGKTFVVKLLILYTILFTDRKFILVVSAIKDNAASIIADVADMLDSPNIRAVFGNWRVSIEVDRQDKKKFYFNGRPVILKAAGAGTAIRGIQEKNARPDVVICDDVQTRECAESLQESASLIKWFVATLMKAKSPTGCSFFYIGNMYPDLQIKHGVYTCILRNLQKSKFWTSLIVGGILSDGSALWEELQPRQQLLEEYKNDLDLGCPEIFYAEVLNSPQPGQSAHFNQAKVSPVVLDEGRLHAGNFVLIDPSGYKSTSDSHAIGYFEVLDGIPVLADLVNAVLTPKQCIEKAIEFCMRYNCSCIAVESVAYQHSLIFWMEEALELMGMRGIEVVEVSPAGRSKQARILTMLKQWQSAELGVANNLFSRCIHQATAFNPLKKDNVDDVLDLLAYAPEVVQNYPQALAISAVVESFEDWKFARESLLPDIPVDCLMA